MKLTYKVMNIITTIYNISCYYLGAFLVHIYTCYAVYVSYGFFLGILAFFSPVISEIVMFLLYLIFYGIFNEYCIIILLYVGMIAISFLLSYVTSLLEEKLKRRSCDKINKSFTIDNNKYTELANILIRGLGAKDIDDAISKAYQFYKENGVEVDNVKLKSENKEKTLCLLTMIGLGTNNIDDTIKQTKEFYEGQGINIE